VRPVSTTGQSLRDPLKALPAATVDAAIADIDREQHAVVGHGGHGDEPAGRCSGRTGHSACAGKRLAGDAIAQVALDPSGYGAGESALRGGCPGTMAARTCGASVRGSVCVFSP
jgi:hypothetical protein